VLGAGLNAPEWSGKTIYPEENYASVLPISPAAHNGAGFRGLEGFDGFGGTTYAPTRVTYPTVSTPLGTKPVLQFVFPGSRGTINAVNGATAPWQINQEWSVQTSGAWTGMLVFERSSDGVVWDEVSLRGTFTPGQGNSADGTSTTINGRWAGDTGNTIAGGFFRVRASSWTSGTATVDVGMLGGFSPARASSGLFTGNPTRIYTRTMMRVDPSWDNGGITSCKFLFYSQDEGNNHHLNLWGNAGYLPIIGLQGAVNATFEGTVSPSNNNGAWWDVEFLAEANTAGVANGKVRVWVNNVLVLTSDAVEHFDTDTTPRFTSILLDPVFGGGETPPPRNNFVQFAGWYRESAA
jgi:hypothetical protein